LKANDTKHHKVKKRNSIAGFPPKILSVRIGNNIITNEAAIQLAAVVNGIILGCTISAIYNHTTGPNEIPNTPIYENKPTIIII
jgi:hypothetical protein